MLFGLIRVLGRFSDGSKYLIFLFYLFEFVYKEFSVFSKEEENEEDENIFIFRFIFLRIISFYFIYLDFNFFVLFIRGNVLEIFIIKFRERLLVFLGV